MDTYEIYATDYKGKDHASTASNFDDLRARMAQLLTAGFESLKVIHHRYGDHQATRQYHPGPSGSWVQHYEFIP